MIILKQGDITKENVEVIVNAANSGLRGGGGVDGAIHKAAGPSVLQECKSIGSCPTGEAVITNAGNLKAKKIIHTVGPRWHGGQKQESHFLQRAYQNSFELALGHKLRTIAFPAISTGIYGYPLTQATHIALGTGLRFEKDFSEIRFICFSKEDLIVYQEVFTKIKGSNF